MAPHPDEGYIKFNYDWLPLPLPTIDLTELIFWRQQMYQAGLIGIYPNGIGFGNISMRSDKNTFVISASGSGSQKQISTSHFSLVEAYDIAKNWLQCIGNYPASSESLSHASIYEQLPDVEAVIHIHHKKIWENTVNSLPSTPPLALFGTPAMAKEIGKLAAKQKTPFGIIRMGGHEEGLLFYHQSLAEVGKMVLDFVEKHR